MCVWLTKTFADEWDWEKKKKKKGEEGEGMTHALDTARMAALIDTLNHIHLAGQVL